MAELPNPRFIAHFDLDSFFVSVERLKDSSLIGKPVIVGGSTDRGVVAACSYETRVFGVHSAMPIKQARKLCPQAIGVRGDFESYSHYSRLVTSIIRERVPVLEKASIDEFYMDLTGMDRFFGCSQFTKELKQTVVKETGLPISYALASNKLISKIATNEVKPDGQIEVKHGEERQFLAPLKIERMPGIGEKTAVSIRKMGIFTLKELSEANPALMELRFGKGGFDLIRRANGIDDSPVVPYSERKSISTENTFESDTLNVEFLQSELVRMTEKIAFQLRQQKKLSGCVTVKIRYADFSTETKQTIISYTAADHVILTTVKELFRKSYNPNLQVRLIGVKLSHLLQGEYQMDLFSEKTENMKLYEAMDKIRNRFGEKSVLRASGLNKL
ncbi:DNA polymerase IV [Mucilaginibacter arboris]|uniref:DNA polymerase IV n=1 Tax=Mucilaginibacter arboris TaxID=2682090 RepID=A0A7K1SZQ2_9SPHI|nr:DNA polymerase IV [Mucilaginibacter arboris]MVN22737.1 DNA polymerase IV [Mucilaginibacter arboris]